MLVKELKVNKSMSTPFGKKKEGDIINVNCDANGTPLDLFWRSRVKDSEIDNCVELTKKQSKSKKNKKSSESKDEDINNLIEDK